MVQLASDEFARNGLPADFLSADAIRHLARVSRAEFSPVSAVLGGVISQEVIKAEQTVLANMKLSELDPAKV